MVVSPVIFSSTLLGVWCFPAPCLLVPVDLLELKQDRMSRNEMQTEGWFFDEREDGIDGKKECKSEGA